MFHLFYQQLEGGSTYNRVSGVKCRSMILYSESCPATAVI